VHGSASRGTSNDALYTYDDYRVTLTYTFSHGWWTAATYTASSARDAGYTVLGKNLGDDQFILCSSSRSRVASERMARIS